MSAKFACKNDGFSFPEIEPRLFSFNSPYGACPECNGLGTKYFGGDEMCESCKGARLRREALNVFLYTSPKSDLGDFPLSPTWGTESPDFLTIIDESHVTLPQLRGMYAGDASRKSTLVEYGFRLPTAKDNRPLKYEEFEKRIGSVIYTSATPGEQERIQSGQIVEQIIRPTGLVDPETIVRGVAENGKYKGQIFDFIEEAEKTIKNGFRVLATTLTKKMAEDLSTYLKDLPAQAGKKIKAEYLHSDIKTMERIKILTQFRKGEFNVLVGVNLLREGLDLPEVALIGILDADREGFLRSETSLIQTIGRAARNSEGRVILYADVLTGSMKKALSETVRRRNIQLAYNKEHNITPETIKKEIRRSLQEVVKARKIAQEALSFTDQEYDRTEMITQIEKEMLDAAQALDFERAAFLRDQLKELKEMPDLTATAPKSEPTNAPKKPRPKKQK